MLCEECGGEFEEARNQKGRQKYCSKKCREISWTMNNKESLRSWRRDYQKKRKRPVFCKVCDNPISDERRASGVTHCSDECANISTKRAYKKHRDKKRLHVLNLLGGPTCVYCGCDDIKALEINHKCGGGCEEYKKGAGTAIVDDIWFGRRSVENLEVVCRPCNSIHYMKLKGIEGWKITWIGDKGDKDGI